MLMENVTKNNYKKVDSLKKRYFYKLGAGLIGTPISVIMAAIVPRSLGPAAYGNFTFLTQFFTKTVGFFDTGTSIGFYTKLSQRLHEKGLIKFYWFFVIFMSFMVIIFVPIVFMFNKQNILWPDQSIKYICMALIFSLFTWYSQIVIKIVDAYGYTAKGEIVRIIRRVIGLVIILALFFIGNLNLTTFFCYHYVCIFIIIIGCRYFFKKNGISLFPKIKLKSGQVKNYIKEFWIYSHPLLTYSFVGLFVGIFDIWILQKIAGSVQQAFYGLAFRISGIIFLFASSMTPLITREFSIAFGNKNIDKMRKLFIRYIPMLYVVVAFFSIFLSVNANTVSLIVGGRKFIHASVPIMIMSIYPMHQTYGQLSGSVFYATVKTKLYRNIGIIMMLIGLPVTFFLLASPKYYGLNLGATGLALKMVLIQFIGVNIQLWFNSKYLKMSFLKFFSHQLYTIVYLAFIAFLSLHLCKVISSNLIISFLANGLFYVIFTILLIYFIPGIISSSRNEINKYFRLILNKLKGKLK